MLPSFAMFRGVRHEAVTHSVRPYPSRTWMAAWWSKRNLSKRFFSSTLRLSPPE